MGIWTIISGWIRQISIPKSKLIEVIDFCDTDRDGNISIGEFVDVVSMVIKRFRA